MKKDGKYRYTLQFGSETDEEYRAGELLESLGNKKSAVIIAALNEDLASRPELQLRLVPTLIKKRWNKSYGL